MHIAIDIDDTITHAPEFFAALTNGLAGVRITVVTFRDDAADAEATLRQHGIRWDRLVVSSDPALGCGRSEPLAAWKARVVGELGVDVFFDDAPEVCHRIAPPTRVFMCCDDVMRGWIGSSLQRGK